MSENIVVVHNTARDETYWAPCSRSPAYPDKSGLRRTSVRADWRILMARVSHPQGWVDKKGKNWVAHVNVPVTNPFTGEMHRIHKSITLGKMTKGEAITLNNKWVMQTLGVQSGMRPNPRITLTEFTEGVYFVERKGSWSDATNCTATYIVRHYILSELGDLAVEDVTTTQLQKFLNGFKDRGYAVGTGRKLYQQLKAIMRLAWKRKFIGENPASDLFIPNIPERKKVTLKQETLARILAKTENPMDRCLMALAIFVGLRRGETFGLVWGAIDLKNRELKVRSVAYRGKLYMQQAKTKESFSATVISEELVPFILAWRELCPDTSANALVFPYVPTKGRNKGKVVPWNVDWYMQHRMKPIAEKFRLSMRDLNFQVTRRSMLTDLSHYGTIKDVQVIARHKNPQTTLKYYIQPVEASVRSTSNARSSALLSQLNTDNKDASSELDLSWKDIHFHDATTEQKNAT